MTKNKQTKASIGTECKHVCMLNGTSCPENRTSEICESADLVSKNILFYFTVLFPSYIEDINIQYCMSIL